MLYHVTVDKVSEGHFSPRVPSSRAPGENDTIPRICFADSISGCIKAMPQSSYILCSLLDIEKQFGLLPILFVYSIDENKIKEYKNPVELDGLVPDVKVTREHWIMEDVVCDEGYIRIVDYVIANDRFGKAVVSNVKYELLKAMPDKSVQTILEVDKPRNFCLHDILMVYFNSVIQTNHLDGTCTN